MKVICISGKARHGKDFTASAMKEVLEENGQKVLIMHYADLLKFMCEKYFDWDGNKDEKGRSLLQYVGTEMVRSQDPDYWVKYIVGVFKLFRNVWDVVLISDVRFPNEIEGLRGYDWDVISIRVMRADFDNGLTSEQKSHSSETALDDYKFDITLSNDGTDNYKSIIAKTCTDLLN